MSKNNQYHILIKGRGLFLCLMVVCLIHKVNAQALAANSSKMMTSTIETWNEKDSLPVPDSTKKKKVKVPICTFFWLGIDASKLLASTLQKQYDVLECQADIFYKNNVYFAAEFGAGNSIVENDYLKYKSKNSFVTVGLDKTFFNQEFKGDFDNAFVGLRYGVGFIKRGDATYSIHDIVWGNSQGIIPSQSFMAHWLELTGGFRMELLKHLFVGWNVRARTFINPKKFENLPPAYVTGFGRSDKKSAFGYNFYILYGFGKRK